MVILKAWQLSVPPISFSKIWKKREFSQYSNGSVQKIISKCLGVWQNIWYAWSILEGLQKWNSHWHVTNLPKWTFMNWPDIMEPVCMAQSIKVVSNSEFLVQLNQCETTHRKAGVCMENTVKRFHLLCSEI